MTILRTPPLIQAHVKFGQALTRDSSGVINAVPVMSKPAKVPVMAQQLKGEGFANTLWGSQPKAKSGDYAVFYGFNQDETTGEIKPDINIVDQDTFKATYSDHQGGMTFQQEGEAPPSSQVFTAYKTRAPHKLLIPSGKTEVFGKEGKAPIPEGHVVVVDGTGDPYTNKAGRALTNFEPIEAKDVDANNKAYTAEQIEASQAIFPQIRKHFDITA